MTRDEISKWLTTAEKNSSFEVKQNASLAYAQMPIDCRKYGASLVLLELEILLYEYHKNNNKDFA